MSLGPGPEDRGSYRRPSSGPPGRGSAGAAQDPGLTLQAARIVQILFRDPSRGRYYTELAELTGMAPASARWVLTRLAESGWVSSTVVRGDRVRRMYTLTPAGRAAAPAALAAARSRLEAVNRDVPARKPPSASLAAAGGPGTRRAAGDIEMTLQTARVVQAFASDPFRPRYTAALAEATGMATTTVRKILARMTAAGWLADAAEEPGTRGGRPGAARHFYTLTPAGRAAIPAALPIARRQLEALNRELALGDLEAGPG